MESNRRPYQMSEKDNLADLIARMSPDDRQLYESFGHVWTDAAFVNRRFFVVKTAGKRRDGTPNPPEVLGSIRVIDFHCDAKIGSTCTLMDDKSSRTLQVGYVPVKLFRFPVFVSIPVYQGVKWEAKEQADGRYTRSLVWGICFKQQSSIKFYNRDNVSVLTPNQYQQAFGDRPQY